MTGQPVHRLEDLLEVGLLDLAQLLERGGLLRRRLGQDHAAHDRQAVLAEEHVLGAAQADALGAEAAGVGGIGAVVGVGPHRQLALADLVGPAEDRLELGRRLGRAQRTAPSTTWPVEPSREMTSPSWTTTSPTVNCLPAILMASAPTTAGVPQPAGHDGGVRHEAAPGGEDALGDHHPVDVLGAGLAAHEDDLLAPVGRVGGVVGGEVHPPDRGTGRRGQALGDHLQVAAGELRVQHLVEVVGGDALHGLGLGDLPASLPRRSLVMSTAMRSAAAPVRLPTRVCSIQSLPCSMVNSVSHMSR